MDYYLLDGCDFLEFPIILSSTVTIRVCVCVRVCMYAFFGVHMHSYTVETRLNTQCFNLSFQPHVFQEVLESRTPPPTAPQLLPLLWLGIPLLGS